MDITHLDNSLLYEEAKPISLIDDDHMPQKSIRNTNLRWIMLMLTSINGIGIYYCLDGPQALEKSITEKFQVTNVEFGLLYSVYGLPNIILPFFGGMIIDILGVRLGISVFSFLLVIGQFLVTLGAAYNTFAVMVLGRVVFGLGGESLGVASCAMMTKWFKDKELSLSMGVILCIARIGSSINSFLSPKLALWTGELYAPLLVGTVVCLISWLTGLLLNHIDRKIDIQEGEQGGAQEASEKVSFRDLKSFKRIYYLLLFNGFFIYCGFYGLNANLNDILVERFGFDSSSAGNLIPIMYLIAAVFLPIFGISSDNKGRRVVYIFWASVLFLVTHFVIAFLPGGTLLSPTYSIIGPLIAVGAFYSVYAAIYWPCIPLTVPEKLTGTAFGIVVALQNLGLAMMPLLLGVIHDQTTAVGEGYFWTEITLGVFVACGIIFNVFIYFEDAKTGGKLDKPLNQQEKEPLLTATRANTIDSPL